MAKKRGKTYTAKAHLANVYQKVGVDNKILLLLKFIEDVKKSLN